MILKSLATDTVRLSSGGIGVRSREATVARRSRRKCMPRYWRISLMFELNLREVSWYQSTEEDSYPVLEHMQKTAFLKCREKRFFKG